MSEFDTMRELSPSETHLLVLWPAARVKEREILDDVARHVDVVAVRELAWPVPPEEGFKKFYGAKLEVASGKVASCGGGAFLLVVVKDRKPRYGMMETSRGCERVNLRLFAMKSRYRRWTGGGHKVHASNTPEEARRDLFLLTGYTAAEWSSGNPPQE